MSIVTKTGDRGHTSLYSGERVEKDHLRIQMVGLLDELNAHIGFVEGLHEVQCELFDLGAMIANSKSEENMSKALARIEKLIPEMEAELPKLTNFILPGGHELACHAHLARTVCRRAERSIIQLDRLPVDSLPYLNRLSDYLFLVARICNQKHKTNEVIWEKP